MELNITVTGLDSIDTEFQAFQAELAGKVQAAMDEVGANMTMALKQHIEIDVYDRYRPKEYPRRRDNPQFGPALSDMGANTAIYNRGTGVTLEYKPSGEHSGTMADLRTSSDYYNADSSRKIKPNPVHGDDLIRRIETGRGYDWKPSAGSYPARPFWQNFVNDMIEGGELDRYFTSAMAMQGEIVEPTGVLRDSGDGEY